MPQNFLLSRIEQSVNLHLHSDSLECTKFMVLKLHIPEEEDTGPRKNRSDWLYNEEPRHLREMAEVNPPKSIIEAMRYNTGKKLAPADDSSIGFLINEERARERPPTRCLEALQFYLEQTALEYIEQPLVAEQASLRELDIDVPELLGNDHEGIALYTLIDKDPDQRCPFDVVLVYSKPRPTSDAETDDFKLLPPERRQKYLRSLPRSKIILTGSFVLTENWRFQKSMLSLVQQVSKTQGAVRADALTNGNILQDLLHKRFGRDGALLAALKKKGRDDNPLPQMKADVLLTDRGAIAHPLYFPHASLSLKEWDLDQEKAGKRASDVCFDVLLYKMKYGDPNAGNSLSVFNLVCPPRDGDQQKGRRRAA